MNVKKSITLSVEEVKESIELISYRETTNLGLSLLKKRFSLITEITDTGNNIVIYYPEWGVRSLCFKDKRFWISIKNIINSLTTCTNVLKTTVGNKFYFIIFVKN